MSLGETAAYWLLIGLQHTPFRGSCNTFARPEAAGAAGKKVFSQARLEADNRAEFLSFFNDLPAIGGRTALDLGSGYGGKTVALAKELDPAKMVGIEPFDNMVTLAREYADSVGATNCEFRLCGHLDIPATDGEFDAILSHDVIEHVADPAKTLAEMHRVLRPGGRAYIAFTPYWGALSHHLGYITRVPFIDWVFSARTLVSAINRILSTAYGARFGTSIQPEPKRSYDGRMEVLPALNGVGGKEFLELARKAGFQVEQQRYVTIAERFLPRQRLLGKFNAAVYSLHPFMRELFNYNLTCILRKVG